jgi:hypothetical protein
LTVVAVGLVGVMLIRNEPGFGAPGDNTSPAAASLAATLIVGAATSSSAIEIVAS